MHPQNKDHRLDRMLHDRLDTFHHRVHTVCRQPQHHSVCHLLLSWSSTQHNRVVLTLFSSCFLSGPKTQFQDMMKQSRLLLTILYVGSMIATLLLAFLLPENLKGLVIITLVIQMVSYFLYTFSFVPFGLKLLKKFCACLFSE